MNTPPKPPGTAATSALSDSIRIVTLQAHILAEQTQFPNASGTFSWILCPVPYVPAQRTQLSGQRPDNYISRQND